MPDGEEATEEVMHATLTSDHSISDQITDQNSYLKYGVMFDLMSAQLTLDLLAVQY